MPYGTLPVQDRVPVPSGMYRYQSCWSVTFCYGSGSADPCLWPIDPDPDPTIFVLDFQDATKKLPLKFFRLPCLLLRKKVIKSQNSRNQGFSCCFCLMIEGSGAESGSAPLNNVSGSRRPDNLWIRTPNTGRYGTVPCWYFLRKALNVQKALLQFY